MYIFGRFLLRPSRINNSKVMSIAKFGIYHFSLLPRFKQGSPAAPIIIGIHYPNHLRLLYWWCWWWWGREWLGPMIMTCMMTFWMDQNLIMLCWNESTSNRYFPPSIIGWRGECLWQKQDTFHASIYFAERKTAATWHATYPMVQFRLRFDSWYHIQGFGTNLKKYWPQ